MNEIYRDIIFGAVLIVPALAISARLALRPIVESMARLKETFLGQDARSQSLEAEVRELRAEVQSLRSDMAALQKADAFYRQLQGPKESDGP